MRTERVWFRGLPVGLFRCTSGTQPGWYLGRACPRYGVLLYVGSRRFWRKTRLVRRITV